MTDPSDIRVVGPLASCIRSYWEHLKDLGYTHGSANHQALLAAHLSRWMLKQRLTLVKLTDASMTRFLRCRRRLGYRHLLSEKAIRPLRGFLQRRGFGPFSRSSQGSLEVLLERYGTYLAQERGVTRGTIRTYTLYGRRFLLRHPVPTAEACAAYVLGESRRLRVGSVRNQVTGLRSLLRFLHLDGRMPISLASALPRPACWRLSGLPKALEPEQVERLLDSCIRSTSVGLRDHAVLLLLARLGLRAHEVAGLRLEDVDWRQGNLLIRGKGDRHALLPLPAEVGQALAEYVRRGGVRKGQRELFVRVRAPRRGLSSDGVQSIVRMACLRVGMQRVGSHRLRHSVATSMLARGAGLPEISQVLRHRAVGTTAIYAKVDRLALAAVVHPWPGSAP